MSFVQVSRLQQETKVGVFAVKSFSKLTFIIYCICVFSLKDSYYRPAKMMQCFHFMVEPAKNLTAKIKVTRFTLLKKKEEKPKQCLFNV